MKGKFIRMKCQRTMCRANIWTKIDLTVRAKCDGLGDAGGLDRNTRAVGV
jgi:hypothetical protein